jgi:hypothetical protein
MRATTDTHVRVPATSGTWEPGDATRYAATVLNDEPKSDADRVLVIIDSPNGVEKPVAQLYWGGALSEGIVAEAFGIDNSLTVTHITALLCFMLDRPPLPGEDAEASFKALTEVHL